MKKHLSGFTLIEILIVIIIIGLLLLITLNISSNQTQLLRYRINREITISNYNTFIIRAITSSDGLDLKFSESTGQTLINPDFFFESTPSMRIISLNNQSPPFNNLSLSFSGGINQCIWYNESTSTSIIETGVEMILEDVNTSLTGALCVILSTCKIQEGGC